MKIAPVVDVEARFSKYLEDCGDSPVVVTKSGRPAAVLVAVSDEEELERLVLAHTPRLLTLLDAAHDRIKKGGGVKHDGFWKAADRKARRTPHRIPARRS